MQLAYWLDAHPLAGQSLSGKFLCWWFVTDFSSTYPVRGWLLWSWLAGHMLCAAIRWQQPLIHWEAQTPNNEPKTLNPKLQNLSYCDKGASC